MKTKGIFSSLLILPAVFFLAGATQDQDRNILKISDRELVSLPEMAQNLKKVRLVFMGELHDRPEDHRMELDIVRSLYETGIPVAIGMEMFQAEYQSDLDIWVQGRMSEDAFIRIYKQNWEMPWDLYKDIFLYAREKRIPIIGLNVDPDVVAQVAKNGFGSLSPEELKKLPGVTCNVDAEYEKFIRRALGEHGADVSTFRHFCEAQMVWDSVMAVNLVRFLRKHPDYTVVVMAGSGHSWKFGIPEQVRRRSDYSFRVILPELPGKAERENVTTAEADYLWLRH